MIDKYRRKACEVINYIYLQRIIESPIQKFSVSLRPTEGAKREVPLGIFASSGNQTQAC